VGVALAVEGGELVLRITGRDAFFALSRGLRIPLPAVAGVAVAPRRLVPATGLRLPGTSWPGVIRAGSYGTGGSRDFWLVRKAEQVLVIELEPGAAYRRIVFELPDPHTVALQLRPELGAYTGTFTER
jgi:hypothetical protein